MDNRLICGVCLETVSRVDTNKHLNKCMNDKIHIFIEDKDIKRYGKYNIVAHILGYSEYYLEKSYDCDEIFDAGLNVYEFFSQPDLKPENYKLVLDEFCFQCLKNVDRTMNPYLRMIPRLTKEQRLFIKDVFPIEKIFWPLQVEYLFNGASDHKFEDYDMSMGDEFGDCIDDDNVYNDDHADDDADGDDDNDDDDDETTMTTMTRGRYSIFQHIFLI